MVSVFSWRNFPQALAAILLRSADLRLYL